MGLEINKDNYKKILTLAEAQKQPDGGAVITLGDKECWLTKEDLGGWSLESCGISEQNITDSDFDENYDAVFKPKMTPKALKNAIDSELDKVLNRSDIHNDSPKWREGAYYVFKDFQENNPMSVDKFIRNYAGTKQDASQALKMNIYFKAREAGASHDEAEEHSASEFEAFKRHINDPVLSKTKFEFLPFHK